jgi:hypothetical protein
VLLSQPLPSGLGVWLYCCIGRGRDHGPRNDAEAQGRLAGAELEKLESSQQREASAGKAEKRGPLRSKNATDYSKQDRPCALLCLCPKLCRTLAFSFGAGGFPEFPQPLFSVSLPPGGLNPITSTRIDTSRKSGAVTVALACEVRTRCWLVPVTLCHRHPKTPATSQAMAMAMTMLLYVMPSSLLKSGQPTIISQLLLIVLVFVLPEWNPLVAVFSAGINPATEAIHAPPSLPSLQNSPQKRLLSAIEEDPPSIFLNWFVSCLARHPYLQRSWSLRIVQASEFLWRLVAFCSSFSENSVRA